MTVLVTCQKTVRLYVSLTAMRCGHKKYDCVVSETKAEVAWYHINPVFDCDEGEHCSPPVSYRQSTLVTFINNHSLSLTLAKSFSCLNQSETLTKNRLHLYLFYCLVWSTQISPPPSTKFTCRKKTNGINSFTFLTDLSQYITYCAYKALVNIDTYGVNCSLRAAVCIGFLESFSLSLSQQQ